MTVRIRHLVPGDYRRVRWANDGGWTTEIARDPVDATALFRWRVSIAEIERDGPFSILPGIERDLLLLDGNGMQLAFAGKPAMALTGHLAHVRFDGNDAVDCRLIDGPTRDFNIMARRGSMRSQVATHVLDANPTRITCTKASTWLGHVLAGNPRVSVLDQRLAMASGETFCVDVGAVETPLELAGPCAMILVKFTPTGEVGF